MPQFYQVLGWFEILTLHSCKVIQCESWKTEPPNGCCSSMEAVRVDVCISHGLLDRTGLFNAMEELMGLKLYP